MYVHYAYIWSVHDQCLVGPAKGTHCMLNPASQFSRWLGQCQGGDEGRHVPGFGLRLRHSGPVPPPSALHDRRAPWSVTHFPSGGFDLRQDKIQTKTTPPLSNHNVLHNLDHRQPPSYFHSTSRADSCFPASYPPFRISATVVFLT